MADFDKFDYYVHGTENTGKEFCDAVFHEGLRSKYGCSVHSTMAHLDPKDGDLDSQIKSYAQNHKGTVFVFKVPKELKIGGEITFHRDGSCGFDTCKPVWKASPDGKYSYFTPALIQGSYDYQTQTYTTNKEYNINYNPNGLQYSDELRDALKSNGLKEYLEVEERRKLSFAELLSQDIKSERFVENAFDLTVISANPKAGYNFPFILATPKNPSDTIKLFVEGNNSVHYEKKDGSTQTFAEQETDAIRYAESLCPIDNGESFNPAYLYQQLNQPFIIPIIERCENEYKGEYYTQMLGRNVVLDKNSKFANLSGQIVKMVEDVKRIFIKKGYTVEDKAGLIGMSASGVFAGRMAFIEPESFDACLSLCSNAVQPLPLDRLNGIDLPYPLGTADYKEIFGKEFDKDAYSQIRQLFVVGDCEENKKYNIAKNPRLHDNEIQELYTQVYGDVSIQERQHKIDDLMRKMGMNNTSCVVASGGHAWRNKGRVTMDEWAQPIIEQTANSELKK